MAKQLKCPYCGKNHCGDEEVCGPCQEVYGVCAEIIKSKEVNNFIIPFGKYRGLSLEEVYLKDRSYLCWLAEQSWLKNKEYSFFLKKIKELLHESYILNR